MFSYHSFTIANIQLKMKRCLLLPFDFFKPVLGTRYKPCYSILTLFLKNSQDYVVMISHFGQKSQINHQTCFSTLARMHLWVVRVESGPNYLQCTAFFLNVSNVIKLFHKNSQSIKLWYS